MTTLLFSPLPMPLVWAALIVLFLISCAIGDPI